MMETKRFKIEDNRAEVPQMGNYKCQALVTNKQWNPLWLVLGEKEFINIQKMAHRVFGKIREPGTIPNHTEGGYFSKRSQPP